MDMQTLDFTNPLLDAIGDQPTSRTIKMTNNSFCKRTETMTGLSVQAEQSAEFVLIGDMAYQMLQNNLRQQNSGSDTRVWSLEVDGKAVDLDPVSDDAGTGTDTPAPALTFSKLENCTYDNGVLTYTGGNLSAFNSAGYQAVTDKPVDIAFSASAPTNFFIGSSDDFIELHESGSGLLLGVPPGGDVVNANTGEVILQLSANDVVTVTFGDATVTFTNSRTGHTWTSDPSDYLVNPQYMGFAVMSTDPLTIRAI